MSDRAHLTIDAALSRLAGAGERSTGLFAHGSLRVKVYAPRGVDPQTPHSQDEVYVVMRGSGTYFDGRERHPFGAGDLLFAPAGTEHRFEAFSDGFATWVLFYGSDGGEEPA